MASIIRSAALAVAAAVAAMASPAQAASYPEHYVYDPAFAGGTVLDDSFAAAGQHYGEKAAQLADGSIVVVGLVPGPGQSATQPGGNIGLVHYTASGSRIAWSNPTAQYASYNNIYLTYPNSAATVGYGRVDDLKVNGHFIYVLSDYVASSASRYPMIDVFSDAGQRVIGYSPFGYFNGDIEGAGLAFNSYTINIGGGPVTLTDMAVAASQNNGTAGQADNYVVVMHRYPIDTTDGTLGSAFTGFGTNGTATFALPEPICSNGANPCSGLAASVATTRADTNTPTYYVLGTATTHFQSSGGRSAFIMPVNAQGSIDTDFDYLAIPMDSEFAEPAFGLVAQATGADITGDVLYVGMGSDSATGCHVGGSVITKISDSPGGFDVDSNWGDNGETYLCDNASHFYMMGHSLASDGTRLIVAGVNSSGPALATLYLDGALLDLQSLPWLRANGAPWDGGSPMANMQDAGFQAVVPVASGKFVVAGTLCDSTRGASCPAFGTTQLVSDEIFADGFDGH